MFDYRPEKHLSSPEQRPLYVAVQKLEAHPELRERAVLFIAKDRPGMQMCFPVMDPTSRWRVFRAPNEQTYVARPEFVQTSTTSWITTAHAVPVDIYARFEFDSDRDQVEFMLRHGEIVADIDPWFAMEVPREAVTETFDV